MAETIGQAKRRLIEKEKSKYGKWATTKIDRPANPILYQPVENQKDIDALRTTMGRGNYPLSMTDCEVVGINGDCGLKCPVFLREECPFPDEFEEKFGKEEMEKALSA